MWRIYMKTYQACHRYCQYDRYISVGEHAYQITVGINHRVETVIIFFVSLAKKALAFLLKKLITF